MNCERYWRDGIVLVERGLDDPHRDGCADCTRAHASRQELIEALPLIGAGRTGDPDWEANVWRRIDAERAPAPRRWRWQLAGAFAAACAVALWIGLGRTRPADVRPRVEVLDGGVAMRSNSHHVDDRLQVTVRETSDVWIYRAEHLVMECRARQPSAGCALDAHGMIAEMVLAVPGEYQVIVIQTPVNQPHGNLDAARAALETAGADYREFPPVTVR